MLDNTKSGIITIETERLKVSGLEGHEVELAALFADEKAMEFYPDFITHAKALGALEFLGMAEKVGLFAYTIVLKETGQAIGLVTLNNINEGFKHIEIGYFLLSEHWGKGFAREVVAALVNFLQGQGWHRIEATVYSGNEASEKVLRACGFVLEGVLRDKCMINGKYYDDIVYAIVRQV